MDARAQYDSCIRIKAHILEVLDFLREIGDVPLIEGGTVSEWAVRGVGGAGLDEILSCIESCPFVNDKGVYEINPVLTFGGETKLDCSEDPLEIKRYIVGMLFQNHLISKEDCIRIKEMLGSGCVPSSMLAAAVRERDYMIRAAEGKQFRECVQIRENMREIIEFIRGLDGFVVPAQKDVEGSNFVRVDKMLLSYIYTSNGHGKVEGVGKVEEALEGDPERLDDGPDSHGNIYWTPSYLAFRGMDDLGDLWFSENMNQGPEPLRAVQDLSGIKKRIIDWAVARGAMLLPETVSV